MFIKSRGIFFRLVSNYEVFLFFRRKLGFSADSDYIWWVDQVLEMPGIDPRTSRMQREHSTIWAASPYFITVEEAFVSVAKHFRLKIFWEGVSCIRFHYSVVFWRKLDVLNFGDAGYCSPYFWLDKWALYHLTYIPCLSTLSKNFFA